MLAVDRTTGSPNTPFAAVLVVLSGEAKSLPAIQDAFRAYGRRLPGQFRPYLGGRRGDSSGLADALAHLVGQGWVTRDLDRRIDRGTDACGNAETGDGATRDGWAGQDRFALTETGRAEANRVLAGLRTRKRRVHRLLQPATAARTSMAAQLIVAAIKVPAALISGSTAQLNDAAEEVADVIASAGVYLGLRLHRERAANLLVVALMLAAGCLTLAVAVRRLLLPVTPAVNAYALTVAAASIPLYALRSAYERSAGLRADSPALVSQSIDSRNHALAGLAVTTGLISASLGAPAVDTLIGLALALTILRSGLVLASDLVRARREHQQPDLSRYSLWIADHLQQLVHTRLQTWMLQLVAACGRITRTDLLHRADTALDPATNPLLREYGMEVVTTGALQPALDALITRGLLTGGDRLTLTEAGSRQLQHALRRRRRAQPNRPAPIRPNPIQPEQEATR